MKINIRYLPIKAHYFFYWGGVASIWGFIAVFGKQMGISEVGVGLIFTVAPIAGLIAKPVFGAVADRFKKKKMIFLFFLLLNLMSYLCVAFLPQNPPARPVQLECAIGMSYIRQCGRINPHCADAVIQSFKKGPTHQNNNTYTDHHLDSEEIDNNIRPLTQSNSQRFARSSTSSAHYSPLELEFCKAQCEIHGFLEGIEFCKRLSTLNQPEICSQMRLPKQILNMSVDESEDISISASMPKAGPHVLHFDVKLKINTVTVRQDTFGKEDSQQAPGFCLYMPIEEVAFYNEALGDEVLNWGGSSAHSSNVNSNMNFNFSSSNGHSISCYPQSLLEHCYISCPNNSALNRQLESIQEEEELLDAMNFWMYGSLVVIAWVAMSVVESLGDAMCFQTLGDEADKYGRQRLWGTVGWGSFQLISGYLIDTSSQGKLLKDYTSAFYLTAALLTTDLIVAYKWSVREVEKTKSLRRDLCSVLSNLRIVVFIMACVIVGMCTGLLWNFLFWYVEILSDKQKLQTTCESHQWIKLLQGLIGAVQCAGELPFFFISGWLIQKLGHVHCTTLVLGAFGLRFIIYSILTNPWTILPVELLQGLTYGVFYSTMVSYANKISPPGTSATVIGVIQAAFLGIGVSLGSLVGGLIFNKYGGATAFRVFGLGCLIFCAIHALLMCILNKKSNYGFPSDRTEPEGQEMFKISSSTQDVAESDEGT